MLTERHSIPLPPSSDISLPVTKRYNLSSAISQPLQTTTLTCPPQLPPPDDARDPPVLPPLLSGKLALSRHILCHSPDVQRQMERLNISWGVQYELARGVLAERWTWADVTESVLGRLQGSNVQAAPRVRTVMSEARVSKGPVPCPKSSINLALW
jgi:hypothetical protein